jgi:hypothetical protein
VQGVIQQGPHATDRPEHRLLRESKRKGGFMSTGFVRWLVLAGCIAAVTVAGAAVIGGPFIGFFARIAEGPAEPTASADPTAIAEPGAPSAPALANSPAPPLSAADGARSAENGESESLDLSRTPRDLTREASRRASETLRGALLDEERFPELAACVADGGECDALESKALAAVLTWPLRDDLFRGAYGLAQLEQAWGRDALLDHLIEEVEEAYSRSVEPADRIAALALLDAMQVAEAPPLGAAVYAGLASRPAPEAALLVAQYERAPLGDDAVVDEIWALATEAGVDRELRLRAVRALGFRETAAGLESATEYLDEDGLLTRDVALSVVAPALVRCSSACAPQLETLASGENPAGRLAALAAVARWDPRTQAQVLDAVTVALEQHAALTREESDQLDYLARSFSR